MLTTNGGLELSLDPQFKAVLLFSGGFSAYYDTIGEALANAASGDVVSVNPGIYAESITIPANVRVASSTGVTNDVTITGADTTSTRVILNHESELAYVRVYAPSSGANPAISFAGGISERAEILRVKVLGQGGAGPAVAHSGAGFLSIDHVRVRNGDGGGVRSAYAHSSTGTAFIENIFVECTATYGIEISGAGLIEGNELRSTFDALLTTGLFVNAPADVDFHNIHFKVGCTDGFTMGASSDGATVQMSGGEFKGSSADIKVEAGASGVGTTWTLAGLLFRQERQSLLDPAFVTNATLFIEHIDEGVNDDRGLVIAGQISNGKPLLGSESSFGEGDSSTLFMTVLSHDGVSTWVDNTADAAGRVGAAFGLFQAVDAGNAAYVGNTARTFTGIKSTQTANMVLGSGALVWEYWNGSAWTTFQVMATNADADYAQYANSVFVRANSSEQIRFPVLTDWAKTVVNGTSAYWARIRITSAISVVPWIEQFKIGSNRVEHNADGFKEMFGAAEPRSDLFWHKNLDDDLDGSSPTNVSVSLASGISITPIDNRFSNNANDGNGGLLEIPDGIDTSRPITFQILYKAQSNGAPSDIELELRTAPVQIGDTVDGSLPSLLQKKVLSVGTSDANVLKQVEFDVDISTLLPGELLAFAYFRDATGGNADDTFAGNVAIVKTKWKGYKWHD